VLDIDNKNFFFLYKEKDDEIEEIISLHNYIKDCIDINNENYDYHKYNEEDNLNEGIRLYECIKMLIVELFYISNKVTAIDYNSFWNKPNFFNLYGDNEIECAKSNNKILKSFYIFIIIIIRNFLIFENNEGKIIQVIWKENQVIMK